MKLFDVLSQMLEVFFENAQYLNNKLRNMDCSGSYSDFQIWMLTEIMGLCQLSENNSLFSLK